MARSHNRTAAGGNSYLIDFPVGQGLGELHQDQSALRGDLTSSIEHASGRLARPILRLTQVSCDIRSLKPSTCAMPNVNHVHLPALFEDSVYRAIDVRLAAVKQMAEIRSLRCYRAPVRMLLKTQNGLFEAPVPFHGSFGALGVDFGK